MDPTAVSQQWILERFIELRHPKAWAILTPSASTASKNTISGGEKVTQSEEAGSNGEDRDAGRSESVTETKSTPVNRVSIRSLKSFLKSFCGFKTATDEECEDMLNLIQYLECKTSHRLEPDISHGMNGVSASASSKPSMNRPVDYQTFRQHFHLECDDSYHGCGDFDRQVPSEDDSPLLQIVSKDWDQKLFGTRSNALGLEVRTSQIRGAGLGLFANRLFKKNSWICLYYGKTISLVEVMRRSDLKKHQPSEEAAAEDSNAYVLGGFGLSSVDAMESDCIGRYINHSLPPNAKFAHKSTKTFEAIVVAVEDIHPGDEIYVDYGSGYWK